MNKWKLIKFIVVMSVMGLIMGIGIVSVVTTYKKMDIQNSVMDEWIEEQKEKIKQNK